MIKLKVEWDIEEYGDDNNGYLWGIYYYDSQEDFEDQIVMDLEWFNSKEWRDQAFLD